jgi:hypothetical protein
MDDEQLLEETIQDIMIDICEVLYNHGYKEVPIGPIMRLIGVDADKAVAHDKEKFKLDQEFEKLLEQRKDSPQHPMVPPGTILH